MPRRLAMSSLVALCKEHADLENDDHITLAGWKQRVSLVYGDLYEDVALTGYRFFEYSLDIVATGAASYAEVANHMATAAILRVIDASGRLSPPLIELNPGEEAQFAGQTGNAVGYQLIDDLLYLYPTPTTGTYRWRYIPQPPDLGAYADGDIVDVVTPSGLAFVIWGVVASAKSKSESDLRHAQDEQEKAREKLTVWTANRAMSGRRRVDGDDVESLRAPGWNR